MKKILLLSIFLSCLFSAYSQSKKDYRLVPDFAVVQYAGSIGYVSAGVGYDVLKSNARFSAHFGTVPANRGGKLNVISAKLIFIPATLTIWNRVKLNPVDIGVMGSYNYGDNFETSWPEGVHPRGYYWWNPAFRAHVAMESSVTYQFKKGHSLRSITGYVEFNTNELYFITFLQNTSTIGLWDIVKLGIGGRVRF